MHRVFQTNALGSLARGIGVFTASVILAATNIIAGARDRDGMTGLIQCSNLKYVVRVAARPLLQLHFLRLDRFRASRDAYQLVPQHEYSADA